MNSFGLGLVLNFTDNASSGMRSASQTFNEMNGIASQLTDSADRAAYSVQTLAAAGASLTIVGDQMTQIGRSITGIFASLGQGVINTGLEVQGFQRQLAALYGSDEAGKAKMEEIKQYALDSVFEVKGLMTSVAVMKAVGIEAMDDVASSSGKTTQKLMDYASDLAAMFPNMRNAYGTGVEAAMGALKEYIAEGNALSLKRGAGLDITGLLGEDKGKSIEERTRQVADLVEMMGIAGYTTALMNTPTQQLSKMQDALYNGFAKIAESGVLQVYTDLLTIAADYVSDLVENEERMNTITEIVGGVLTSLITPLKSVLSYAIQLVDSFLSFAEAHPTLAKTILTVVAFSGVALIALGTLLKFAGSIFLLTSAFTQMSILASNGISIFNILGRAVGIVVTKLLPFVALAGLAYIVWSKNLFGIRDLVTGVFKDLTTLFAITFDAFADNTLSEEMFLRARDLGILPFVEAVLLLKYYWGFFVEGFKSGFNSVFDTLNEWSAKFEPMKVSVFDFANKVGEAFSRITGIDMTGGWKEAGDIIGKIVAILTIAIPVIKVISVLIGALSSPIGLIVAALSLLYLAWDNNLFGIQDKMQALVDWFKTIDFAGVLQSVFEPVQGIIEAVFDVFRSEDLKNSVMWIGALLVPLFRNLWDILKSLMPIVQVVFDFIGRVVSGVVNMISTYVLPVVSMLIDRVADFAGKVVMWVSMLVSAVKPIIQNLVSWVQTIWDGWLGDLVSNVIGFVGRVIELLGFIAAGIYDYVIKPIADIISFLLGVLLPVITQVVNTIVDIVMIVVNVIGGVVNGIMEIINGLIDFIIGVFTGDWSRAWEGVKGIFKGIVDSIGAIFKGVINAIILAVNTVIRGFNLIKVPDWVPVIGGSGINIPEIPYLSTGGEIKGEGVSYLHPNEVVVNSDLTKTLGLFLNDYKERSSKKDSQTVVASETPDNTRRVVKTSPVVTVAPENSGTDSQPVAQQPQNDNRVIFEAGSVVIQIANATEAELEKAAEKLMKIIARKQQLQNMALRTV